jgi:hypothetical protein
MISEVCGAMKVLIVVKLPTIAINKKPKAVATTKLTGLRMKKIKSNPTPKESMRRRIGATSQAKTIWVMGT